ncbi:uncharacterized protein PRCAT00003745001 [Priceomyces carsonii]|uniref:uncharacterized protein n=1 Tax=Priceomyces carsonii TaxID=28549 RepID=UPI002EDA2F31|nr:unnamed protein product [Priceomyces carsonii]
MAPSAKLYNYEQSRSQSLKPFASDQLTEIDSENNRSEDAKQLVGNALMHRISEVDHEVCDAGDEDSFFVCDLGEIYRSFQTWMSALSMVRPYYAVKCNNDRKVIELLGSLGVNFDCASRNEIDMILNLGFLPERIVYANPCKNNSYIRHADKVGVNLTTVDNCQELYKLKKFHPTCGILIRIATDDETAQCRLSTKFGCSLDSALNEILPLASELDLNVKGVAFHIGSGAKDFNSIYKAIQESRAIFDKGIQDLGFSMQILDIGGGFEAETFEQSSFVVKISLDKFFPELYSKAHQIEFIAEPGRFFVSRAFTLATHVIARRDISHSLKQSSEIEAMIYINDGVYGNLNCILFDHQQPEPHVLTHKGIYRYGVYSDSDVDDEKGKFFSIWGPTCDGLDCVSNRSLLSEDIQVGDWVCFPNLGAYTSAATTSFNGLHTMSDTVYVCSEAVTGFFI